MVKNTKGGKHHKKGKKKREEKSDGKIIYAEQNQVYASVTKKVGGSRINVSCSDTKDRSGLIPGKFFKRVWMNEGDILLCELNPSDDSQCYILHKYSYKDASLLKSQGHITFNIVEDTTEDNGFDFADKDDLGDNEEEQEFVNPNKMLDIKNVKNVKGSNVKTSSKKENSNKNEDNENSESDDDIEKNENHANSLQSTKWSKNKGKGKKDKSDGEGEEDKKVYTIDDL